MRLIAGAGLVTAAVIAVLFWTSGAAGELAWWAQGQQRALQSALAAQVQALRAGEPGALAALMAACAAYGFVHAAGPGHGKVLITGAAIASRDTALRMSAIATVGSLAQALTAILIVLGAFAILEATARGTLDAAEGWITLLGNVLIALFGAAIIVRGVLSLRRQRRAACCGHRHGPSAEEAARARGIRDTAALVAAMAARPCSGAIVVLVIAWRLDVGWAGALGTLAMGLGTAGITIVVAIAAVASREAAFLSAGTGPVARLLPPALQIAAGTLIFGISAALVVASLTA